MLITLFTIIVLVTLSILIHYEVLQRLSEVIKHAHIRPRLRIIIGLVGALAAHVVEIFVFTIGYYFLGRFSESGGLLNVAGESVNTFADYAYFSIATYTSLGFGDIVPVGVFRYVAGMEVLLGLVLIAWTASFIYVEMQRFWKV